MSMFNDPWWLSTVKVLGVFVLLVLMTLFTIWAERRIVGRMQHRPGPNRTGPFGLLQSLMDGIKLALKEDITPAGVNKAVFILAPIIACGPAFLAWAVIPLGPAVTMFGRQSPLQLTDFPVSVLYILAVASVGIYGIVLAGWSSNSTYSLLGGLRSSAQMISYEIAMGLSFVAVFLYAGSMSTSDIVNAQASTWYIVLLLPSFAIYVTAMVGETNRAPFDLPEAEGELVGGFHTEYSSLKFALFFLAEYVNMVTVSALATTLFLGGWRAPFGVDKIWEGANSGWMPLLWFLAKVFTFLFVFIWLRGTLPRMRYDQFMQFGWKVLIPTSIAWLLVVATARALRNNGAADIRTLLIGGAVIMVAVFALSSVAERQRKAKEQARAEQFAERERESYSKYPVPLTAEQIAAAAPVPAMAADAPADSADAGGQEANHG